MKHIQIFGFILTSFSTFAQESQVLITERIEHPILKASITVGGTYTLFAGQTYEFEVLASDEYDVQVNYKNLEVIFDESSLKSTGPFRYKVTPIDTGECHFTAGSKINDERSTQLFGRSFRAIHYPKPSIYLCYFGPGEVISNTIETCELACAYSPVYGIRDTYPIKSWTAKLNDKSYSGIGKEISSELKEAIARSENRSLLYFNVALDENQTGHTETEAVYIIGNE